MATLRGSLMGWNLFPDATRLAQARDVAKTSWIRWGAEAPDYMSTPGGSSSYGTLNLSPLQADINLCHTYGQRVILVCMGVPTSVNSGSNSGNRWHCAPNSSGGRSTMAAIAVQYAALLDPSKDILELFGQESNIVTEFNALNQPASDWAQATAECILAVRAYFPTLKIAMGAIANYGDDNNATDIASGKCGPQWAAAMVAGDARLKTTAKPDYWSYHPYVTGGGITDYASNNPLDLSLGWGVGQMVDTRTALVNAGVPAPVMMVTEYGEPNTPGPDYTPAYQRQHRADYIQVFKNLEAFGVVGGPWINHTMLQGDSGGVFVNYGTWYADLTPVGGTTGTAAFMVATALEQISGTNPSGSGNFNQATFGFNSALVPFNYPMGSAIPPPGGPGPPTDTSVLIELGVPPTSRTASNTWMIGDTTRGRLDTGGGLAPDFHYFNISNDVQTVNIDRGRNRELDRMQAGQMVIKVRNDRTAQGTARKYDPSNTSSIFYPGLHPGSRLRVTVDGVRLFHGTIKNFVQTHESDRLVYVTMTASDSLSRLNRTLSFKPEGWNQGGRRIERILQKANYRGPRFLTPGARIWQTGTKQSGTALDMISDVTLGEDGLFYASADDVLVFLDRSTLTGRTAAASFSDAAGTSAIQYSAIEEDVSNETLANIVSVTGVGDGAVAQSFTDFASIERYDMEVPLELTLPLASVADQQAVAFELLYRYSTIRSRFRNITIPTIRYGTTIRAQILNMEIGSVVGVDRSPPGSGSPTTNGQVVIVIGVHHQISPRYMETSLDFEPYIL